MLSEKRRCSILGLHLIDNMLGYRHAYLPVLLFIFFHLKVFNQMVPWHFRQLQYEVLYVVPNDSTFNFLFFHMLKAYHISVSANSCALATMSGNIRVTYLHCTDILVACRTSNTKE